MLEAVFFDRDGTININYGYVYKDENLKFVDGIPEIIKMYNDVNVPVIVVTNQAGIAKGYFTEEDMHKFHAYLNKELKRLFGAYIDAFYFCPHHPDYTGECNCRKPNSGMFLTAQKDFNIDFNNAIMYGDKCTDKIAAANVGINQFILVECKDNI